MPKPLGMFATLEGSMLEVFTCAAGTCGGSTRAASSDKLGTVTRFRATDDGRVNLSDFNLLAAKNAKTGALASAVPGPSGCAGDAGGDARDASAGTVSAAVNPLPPNGG